MSDAPHERLQHTSQTAVGDRRVSESDESPTMSRRSKTADTIKVAAVPSKDEQVLGYNHVRRTEQDKQVTRELLRKRPSKWRKHMQYRIANNPRVRYMCLLMVFAASLILFLGLWIFDETKVGFAVSISMVGSAIALFWVIEILIRCPKLAEGLLFHLGLIELVSRRGFAPHHNRGGSRTMTMTMYHTDLDYDDDDAYYHPTRGGGDDLETGNFAATVTFDPHASGGQYDPYGNELYMTADGHIVSIPEYDPDAKYSDPEDACDEYGAGKLLHGDVAVEMEEKHNSLRGQAEALGDAVADKLDRLGQGFVKYVQSGPGRLNPHGDYEVPMTGEEEEEDEEANAELQRLLQQPEYGGPLQEFEQASDSDAAPPTDAPADVPSDPVLGDSDGDPDVDDADKRA